MKTVFLHGELEEEIYMDQPEGFIVPGKENYDEDVEYMSKVSYSSAVGSLMYAMVCSRPDLSYAMCLVSRYMSNPGKEHWNAVQ